MLPYKKPKGRSAFKGLKAYIGVPKEFNESKTSTLPQAESRNIKKGIELGEISKLLGAKF